jgi:hypothetical protein
LYTLYRDSLVIKSLRVNILYFLGLIKVFCL